ncbi:cyclase family protein [Blastococcus saxobsidens]|uniref:Kynurenine formamidase n=1 Tax=Blastococcus saxobsidens TaxID=138336 RepID=A0A4Q7Y828_9ACTN|nr:cyclase family protein [Blastococcus saxobsidens]RZU32135.1 kynurenine formamidase [Blastococcus saxobsidens]
MTSVPGAPISGVVDLSHPLADGMPVYPGDPLVRIGSATTVREHGYNVLHVAMGSQTGTHVDAPYHFLDDGARIDELPLELFLAPAVVVDVRGKRPHTAITWSDLRPVADRLGPGRMLLLHTGWDAHWGSDEYFGHPFLDGEAAERVVAAGVRTVGLDALSLDETVLDGNPAGGFAAHLAVLGAGGVIVENLRGLDALEAVEPVVSVLPLRLAGADGAPVRAVAFEGPPGGWAADAAR